MKIFRKLLEKIKGMITEAKVIFAKVLKDMKVFADKAEKYFLSIKFFYQGGIVVLFLISVTVLPIELGWAYPFTWAVLWVIRKIVE